MVNGDRERTVAPPVHIDSFVAPINGDVELTGDLVCVPDGGKVEEGYLLS
jgi:hypothetical protein